MTINNEVKYITVHGKKYLNIFFGVEDDRKTIGNNSLTGMVQKVIYKIEDEMLEKMNRESLRMTTSVKTILLKIKPTPKYNFML